MNCPPRISDWVILGMGFTQNIGRDNGATKVWFSLRHLRGETKEVLPPQRWNANAKWIAAFIAENSTTDPIIRVVSYSWGCGCFFLRLAKELGKRGLKIARAVLCDPVYYGFGRWWRAFCFSRAIRIPENVVEVWRLRQRQNKPQATQLLWNKEKTHVRPWIELACNHEFCDDRPEFHRLALEVASR